MIGSHYSRVPACARRSWATSGSVLAKLDPLVVYTTSPALQELAVCTHGLLVLELLVLRYCTVQYRYTHSYSTSRLLRVFSQDPLLVRLPETCPKQTQPRNEGIPRPCQATSLINENCCQTTVNMSQNSYPISSNYLKGASRLHSILSNGKERQPSRMRENLAVLAHELEPVGSTAPSSRISLQSERLRRNLAANAQKRSFRAQTRRASRWRLPSSPWTRS